MQLRNILLFCLVTLGPEIVECQEFIPDTLVNNIKLSDYVSTEKVLGVNAWKKEFESNNLFPRIEVVNQNKTQVLRLFFHYGGNKNSVDEFELEIIDKNYKLPKQVIVMNIDSFKTSRNITLQTTKSNVIKILGNKYKVLSKNEDYEQLYYKIDKPSDFLKRFNQYKYYITCTFKENYLIKYSFGFEYP